MAIHGKQLKDASIDLTKLEGISAPTSGQLLLAAAGGAAQALTLDGDLSQSTSGSTLTLVVKDEVLEVANFAAAAVVDSADEISVSTADDTSLPTTAAVKSYVDSAVSTSSGNQSLAFAGDSGSDALALSTDTFTIAGGSNLTTAVTGNQVEIALDPNISLTSATLSGALSVGTDAIIAGTLTVNGNLTVSGTTTTVNTATLTIEDKNIELARNATGNLDADGGGITVADGGTGKTFTWKNSTNTAWTSSDNLDLVSGKAYYIGNSEVLSATGAAKVQDAVAGDGIKPTSGVLSLDLSELTAAVVDVANDSIAIVDSSDSNASRKESIAGLATAMAGTSASTGLKATSGVFEVTLTSFMESGSIATNQVDGSTVDVVTLTYTPVAAIDLRINGIAYPEGSSTAGYWYNDNGTIKWNDDGLHEAGLLLDTNDKFQVIYDYNAS